jgi:hypothetical protein
MMMMIIIIIIIIIMLMDVSIPGDRNVIKKEAEKILKYKDLLVEIQNMWNVKAELITIITGATGTVSESLGQYLRNIPGKHEIKELQKTAILVTAHKLGKVLNVQVQNIFHGRSNITCSRNC